MLCRFASGLLLMVAAPLIVACASPSSRQPSGPVIEVPRFAADDPRVETAGFVAETLRLHEEHNGTRYTLMAFVVGDVLTLGAMVQGGFTGDVRWRLDGRELGFAFTTDDPLGDVPVLLDGAPAAGLVGQGASFRGTTWVNVELPASAYAADGAALQLTFLPDSGAAVVLPDAGVSYVTSVIDR